MSILADLTPALVARRDLAPAQVAAAAHALVETTETPDAKIAFLGALAQKGETPAEVAGFADAYRRRAVNPGVEAWAAQAIDFVGTGGDHAGGFNISSLVTLVLASAGVTVMKHGNGGITSKCGSADLLAALGVDLQATPEKSRRALAELGYCFFFAPAYHTVFKVMVPVRQVLAARGQRTIFNVLGPLINPGRPARTVMGVYSPHLIPRLAGALTELGCEAGFVAHGTIAGDRGIDEVTTATVNHVQGVGRLRDLSTRWSAADFGLPASPFTDLVGGDVATNVAITEAILAGRGPAGLVDTIVLNAAAGLWISGRVADIRAGLDPARALLLGGAVRRKVADTREFYRS
ncbi:MAG: anthranilate phosphoribosyltransferase [Opitutae bacterium]|nr:anthranilate phosphoribosyltransferase [Opitutae bacterium]